MNKKVLLTALILTINFALNAQSWFGGSKKIKGNGNVVTETRTTSNYAGVSAGGSFDVVLVKGNEVKVTIEAEENITPYIETVISGGVLKINYKKNTNIRTTKKVTVTVFYKNLESVALAGSGNVLCTSLIKSKDFKVNLGGSGNITLHVESDTINASIGGSGNIDLEGKANELTCSIAGSGSIKSYGLETEDVYVNLTGSGSLKTTVSSKIKSKIVGSGSVYYKGKPKKVSSKSVGSGGIIDKN